MPRLWTIASPCGRGHQGYPRKDSVGICTRNRRRRSGTSACCALRSGALSNPFGLYAPPHHAGLDRCARADVPPGAIRPMAQVGQDVGSHVIFTKQLARGSAWRHALAGESSQAPLPGCGTFARVSHDRAAMHRSHRFVNGACKAPRASERRRRPPRPPAGAAFIRQVRIRAGLGGLERALAASPCRE
jgi:hypothetical protein